MPACGVCVYEGPRGTLRRRLRPDPPRIVGTPTSELALKGSLSIKLSSEMAQTVAAAQAQLPATRSGAVTRSGIGTIDDLLNEIGAERFERIITYNPEWEDIYDETGINRWYSVSFDESADLDQIGSRFAAAAGVTVVEYEDRSRVYSADECRPGHSGFRGESPHNG